jgi:hypothetical protein
MIDLSEYIDPYHIETIETIVMILVIFGILGLARMQR